jgi:hypothetical protein
MIGFPSLRPMRLSRRSQPLLRRLDLRDKTSAPSQDPRTSGCGRSVLLREIIRKSASCTFFLEPLTFANVNDGIGFPKPESGVACNALVLGFVGCESRNQSAFLRTNRRTN